LQYGRAAIALPSQLRGIRSIGVRQRLARRLLGVLLVCVLAPAPAAFAQSAWHATLGATTDYILRGVSQTYGGGAIQAGASYQGALGWVVGAWGSNVDPYPGGVGSKELDLYAGYARELSEDFSARIAYTHYSYLHDPRRAGYDYDEVALTASYVDRLSLTLSYTPDSTAYTNLGLARKQPTFGAEVSGRWPLPKGLALTGGVGYYDLQRLFGVRYWAGSAGVAFIQPRFEIDLARYVGDSTVARLYGDASADGKVVLSALVRF
jgi:uncharacterized protein (TIGR02001 family)